YAHDAWWRTSDQLHFGNGQLRREDDDAGSRHDSELVLALTGGRRRARRDWRHRRIRRLDHGWCAIDPGHNNRWPDHLARRLQSQGITMGVLNAGIGGNR